MAKDMLFPGYSRIIMSYTASKYIICIITVRLQRILNYVKVFVLTYVYLRNTYRNGMAGLYGRGMLTFKVKISKWYYYFT